MSTENPVLQFSPSSSPWFLQSPSSELMDLDTIAFRPVATSDSGFKSWSLDELLADSGEISSASGTTAAAAARSPSTKPEIVPCDEDEQQQLIKRSRLRESLADALRIISCSEPDALAQVWVPIVKGNKLFLTTQEQPYSVVPLKVDLMLYRSLSTGYIFPSERDAEAYPGLPGRVFTRLAPEWTPNVQFYDRREYLRVCDAARCDVKGTLAVPIMDPSSHSCLGVIELVKNVEKIEYSAELNTICRALQAVNLTAAPEANLLLPEIRSEGREAVFSEIEDILRAVCDIHNLPLAQTWVPCTISHTGSITGSAKGLSLFTKDAPYYVADHRFWGFHTACSEHTLEKGQGVAGNAFMSSKPSFMSDIRSYTKEAYPLVHYARFFQLGGAVAIRLRSSYTGTDDYVLEFFLPPEGLDVGQQQTLLAALSVTMQRMCRSLRLVSDMELVEGVPELVETHEEQQEKSSESKVIGSKKHGTSQKLESKLHKNKKSKSADFDTMVAEPLEAAACPSSSQLENGLGKKKLERRRSLGEKNIGLEVLQQYFAGSLKDAAKSIGVCPTTLKRICRQYGISRWPSRKINKVSRSLIKLQGVIDSVQGIDGAVKLNGLTGELASAAAAAAAITKRNAATMVERSKVEGGEVIHPPEGSSRGLTKNPSCSDAHKLLTFHRDKVIKRSQSCQLPSVYPVKVEPRVHGSCEALSALRDGFMDMVPPSPPAAAEDHADFGAEPVMFGTWSSAEDLLGLDVGCQPSSGDCSSPSGGSNSSTMQAVTVKATLGSDTIRFKMSASCVFEQLKEEVTGRFKLEKDSFALKYLDDDAEWVMLEGDADLVECLDIMKGARSKTIKLAVRDRNRSNTSCHSLSSVQL